MPDPSIESAAMWQDPGYERVYGPADVYAAPAGLDSPEGWMPEPTVHPRGVAGADIGQETLTAQGLVVSIISAVIASYVVSKVLGPKAS